MKCGLREKEKKNQLGTENEKWRNAEEGTRETNNSGDNEEEKMTRMAKRQETEKKTWDWLGHYLRKNCIQRDAIEYIIERKRGRR